MYFSKFPPKGARPLTHTLLSLSSALCPPDDGEGTGVKPGTKAGVLSDVPGEARPVQQVQGRVQAVSPAPGPPG